MALGKWIGATLGFTLGGGILGAIAGFAIGSMFDKALDSEDAIPDQGGKASGYRTENTERNGFLFSLMVMSAHMVQADGKIMHSEMEMIRQFLRVNFGESAVGEGNQILLRLFEYRKQQGEHEWQRQIRQACMEMRMAMPEEQRLQLMAFLSGIAKADGRVDESEVMVLRELSANLGFSPILVDQLLSLGGKSIDDAYKVLGIEKTATDEEVKRAYKKMAMQYHPDRVATLGDDVKEAANRKFQEINEAKERIYKERGL